MQKILNTVVTTIAYMIQPESTEDQAKKEPNIPLPMKLIKWMFWYSAALFISFMIAGC